MPSLLCQSYAIREVEAGADDEAEAAEHVEDAAPEIRCYFHRCARLQAAHGPLGFFGASGFVPLDNLFADAPRIQREDYQRREHEHDWQ